MENKKLTIYEDTNGIRNATSIIKQIEVAIQRVYTSFKSLGFEGELTMTEIGTLIDRNKEAIGDFLRQRALGSRTDFVIDGLKIEKSAMIGMIQLPDYTQLLRSLLKLSETLDSLRQYDGNEKYRGIYRGWASLFKIVENKLVVDQQVLEKALDQAFRIILNSDDIEVFNKLTEFCQFLNSRIITRSLEPSEWINSRKFEELFLFNQQSMKFELNPGYFNPGFLK